MTYKKPIWQQPWGYAESFLLVIALLLGAVLTETVSGLPAPAVTYPVNIAVLIFVVFVSIGIHLLSGKEVTVRWFSSVPASIGAIGMFLTLTLVMALVPQSTEAKELFCIYNVTSSWAYYLATAYLLIILGAVSIRRFLPFNRKNIGFGLNHLGLWITIATATFGAGDIQKYTMVLSKEQIVWQAYNGAGDVTEMNFAIKLLDFSIEEYPAKLAIIDGRTGDFLFENRKKAIFDIDSGQGFDFQDLRITALCHLSNAMYFDTAYYPISDIGATQAYNLQIENRKTSKKLNGWVGAPSFTQPATYLSLGDSVVIAALQPEAKRFASRITVYQQDGTKLDTVVEVNKPVSIAGAKLYQTGYDEKKGRWSETSIVEIVRDPWLSYVYIGICMMIAGSVYIIWFGRATNSPNDVD